MGTDGLDGAREVRPAAAGCSSRPRRPAPSTGCRAPSPRPAWPTPSCRCASSPAAIAERRRCAHEIADVRARGRRPVAVDEFETFCTGVRRLCDIDLLAVQARPDGAAHPHVRRARAGPRARRLPRRAQPRRRASSTRFLDRVTINVSQLWRNPEQWDDLGHARCCPSSPQAGRMRAWSAGCSYGAEAYTLAAVCGDSGAQARQPRAHHGHRHRPPHGRARPPGRSRPRRAHGAAQAARALVRARRRGWRAEPELRAHRRASRPATCCACARRRRPTTSCCAATRSSTSPRTSATPCTAGSPTRCGPAAYLVVGATERVARPAEPRPEPVHPFVYRKDADGHLPSTSRCSSRRRASTCRSSTSPSSASRRTPTTARRSTRSSAIAHSLKGMSATMGFEKIAALTHAMEDVFELLRQRRAALDREAVDVLLACLDALSRRRRPRSRPTASSGSSPSALIARLRGLVRPRTRRPGGRRAAAPTRRRAARPRRGGARRCTEVAGHARRGRLDAGRARLHGARRARRPRRRLVGSVPDEDTVDGFDGRAIEVWVAGEPEPRGARAARCARRRRGRPPWTSREAASAGPTPAAEAAAAAPRPEGRRAAPAGRRAPSASTPSASTSSCTTWASSSCSARTSSRSPPEPRARAGAGDAGPHARLAGAADDGHAGPHDPGGGRLPALPAPRARPLLAARQAGRAPASSARTPSSTARSSTRSATRSCTSSATRSTTASSRPTSASPRASRDTGRARDLRPPRRRQRRHRRARRRPRHRPRAGRRASRGRARADQRRAGRHGRHAARDRAALRARLLDRRARTSDISGRGVGMDAVRAAGPRARRRGRDDLRARPRHDRRDPAAAHAGHHRRAARRGRRGARSRSRSTASSAPSASPTTRVRSVRRPPDAHARRRRSCRSSTRADVLARRRRLGRRVRRAPARAGDRRVALAVDAPRRPARARHAPAADGDRGERAAVSGGAVLADGRHRPDRRLRRAGGDDRDGLGPRRGRRLERRRPRGRPTPNLQLDALRELANIGSGTAGTALSSSLGRSVDISVPKALALPLGRGRRGRRRPRGDGHRASCSASSGDLDGIVADALRPTPTRRRSAACSASSRTAELGHSALGEIGNILGTSYLGALGAMIGMELEPAPPQTVTDMLGAIVASVARCRPRRAATPRCCSTPTCTSRASACSCSFLLLPTAASVGELLARLGVCDDRGRDDGPHGRAASPRATPATCSGRIGLGSCIGLALIDPRTGVAGLAHVMLPGHAGRAAPATPAKFADRAVPALARRVVRRRRVAEPRSRPCSSAARRCSALGGRRLDVGARNEAAVRAGARRGRRIRVRAAETGGTRGRTLRVHVGEGWRRPSRRPAGRRVSVAARRGTREGQAMSDRLSDDRIAALVERAARRHALDARPPSAAARAPAVRRIDFSRPTKFTHDQQRRLRRAHETFCRKASSRLSAELRMPVDSRSSTSASSRGPTRTRSSPPTSLLAPARDRAASARGCCSAPSSGSSSRHRARCSAARSTRPPRERALTDIDLSLARRFFGTLVEDLSAVWRTRAGARPRARLAGVAADAGAARRRVASRRWRSRCEVRLRAATRRRSSLARPLPLDRSRWPTALAAPATREAQGDAEARRPCATRARRRRRSRCAPRSASVDLPHRRRRSR